MYFIAHQFKQQRPEMCQTRHTTKYCFTKQSPQHMNTILLIQQLSFILLPA